MISVTYNGREKVFDTVDKADEFCWDLMIQGIGSDIWVDEELYKSYVHNFIAGTWVIE